MGAADLAERVRDAVLAVPGVTRLHGGEVGEVATHLVGRTVPGVRLRDDRTEVHVAVAAGAPVRATAGAARDAARALRPAVPVLVVVEEVDAPPPPGQGWHGTLLSGNFHWHEVQYEPDGGSMAAPGAVLDRTLGVLTSAARSLTTPLALGDYLGLLDPLLNGRELRGRIEQVRPETDSATTLVIRPGVGWRFRHLPGQWISIGLEVDGRFHWRSYSLTSPPERGRRLLTVTVKAMPEGFLSHHLARSTPRGTVVRLAAPAGEFVLPDPPPARILLIGAGSGVTPLIAMIRTMVRRGTLTDVVLVTSFTAPDSALFRDELLDLAAKDPGFRLVEHWSGSEGHLTPADLTGLVPDWQARQSYACGPRELLEACEQHWRETGSGARLHVEHYTVPQGDVTASGGTVTFARSGKQTEADGATRRLEAGEAAGVEMPFGCRMGMCHTCTVPLRSGTVVDIRDGSVTDETNRSVQTCISVAAGDCELEI